MSTCDAIGIDFGTSFTRVAVFHNGKLKVLRNEDNEPDKPTIYWKWEDASLTARKTYLKRERLENVLSENRGYTLIAMKKIAEAYLKQPVSKAVITVPASFNMLRRKSIVEIGKRVGFQTVQLINEPTAVAIDFYCGNKLIGDRNFFVFQLGGGTFDASIIKVTDGPTFQVESTCGNAKLGEVDFDQRLFNCLIEKLDMKLDQSSPIGLGVVEAVRKIFEKAKMELSRKTETTIKSEVLNCSQKISRKEFEKACSDLFKEIEEKIEMTFKNTDIRKSQIDHVLIVGGSTRIPKIQEIIMKRFGEKAIYSQIITEAAVYGAAIQATTISRQRVDRYKNLKFTETLPNTIEIECSEIRMKIMANTESKNSYAFCIGTDGKRYDDVITFKIYEEELKQTNHMLFFKRFSKSMTVIDTIEIKVPLQTDSSIFRVVFRVDKNGILNYEVETRTSKENDTESLSKSMTSSDSNLSVASITSSKSPTGTCTETSNIIGIDLGTTYSCVGVFKQGKILIVENETGNRTTPSEVAFFKNEVLVGEAARAKSRRDPTNTLYNVKRFMGRKYENVAGGVSKYPFRIEEVNGEPVFDVRYENEQRQFSPVKISAEILKKMKTAAENCLDAPVKDAVITVPAYFNNSQRRATKHAAAEAGLNAIRIINEPTAAAMAYTYEKEIKDDKTVLIYDLGGGTFDVSIVKISNEGRSFEVIATGGDTQLGGADFTQRLMRHFITKFMKEHPDKKVDGDQKTMRKILDECERVKRNLTTVSQTQTWLDLCGIEAFSFEVLRSTFENLCADLFGSTILILKRTLDDANLEVADIDDVVLVGGSTSIPKIQEVLEEFFGGKELIKFSDPDYAVAMGATAQAVALSGIAGTPFSNMILRDVTPLTLGLNTGKDNQMSVVIPRNTPIPTKSKHMYQPWFDYQTEVKFEIFEGENECNDKNHRLGELSLSGFPPDIRNKTQLDVTFEIDSNGILTVSAIEKLTGKEASVKLNFEVKTDKASTET